MISRSSSWLMERILKFGELSLLVGNQARQDSMTEMPARALPAPFAEAGDSISRSLFLSAKHRWLEITFTFILYPT